jgi:hypothetical protein
MVLVGVDMLLETCDIGNIGRVCLQINLKVRLLDEGLFALLPCCLLPSSAPLAGGCMPM